MDNYRKLIEDILWNALNSGDIRNKCKDLFEDDQRAAEMLLEIAMDDKSSKQFEAIIALGVLKNMRAARPLMAMLQNGTSEHERYIIEALGEIGVFEAIPLFNEILLKKERVYGVHEEALKAINKRHSSQSIDYLYKFIKSASYHNDMTELAIIALKNIPHPNAVKALLNIIADHNNLLGKGDWEIYYENIIQRKQLNNLAKGYDRNFPKNAIAALFEITGEHAIEPIIEFSHSENFAIRILTSTLLGGFKRDDAVERLIEMLSDADPKVQVTAVNSLCLVGNSKSIQPLIELLKTTNKEVRSAAARTLNILTNKSFFFGNGDYNKWIKWYAEK